MRNGCPLRSDALGWHWCSLFPFTRRCACRKSFYYIVTCMSLVIPRSLSKTGSRVLFIPLRAGVLEQLHTNSITSVSSRRRKRVMVSLISIDPAADLPLTYSTNREGLNPNPAAAFLKFSPSFVWSSDSESSSASSLLFILYIYFKRSCS